MVHMNHQTCLNCARMDNRDQWCGFHARHLGYYRNLSCSYWLPLMTPIANQPIIVHKQELQLSLFDQPRTKLNIEDYNLHFHF